MKQKWLLMLVLCIFQLNGQHLDPDHVISFNNLDIAQVKEKGQTLPISEKLLDNITKENIRTIINLVEIKLRQMENGSASECLNAIFQLLDNSTKFMEYYGSLGKPGSGILEGDRFMMGVFDECPDAGHYCIMVNIKTNLLPNEDDTQHNTTVPFGTCAPKTCSAADLSMIFKVISVLIKAWTGVEYYYIEENNDTYEKYGISNGYCYPPEKPSTKGQVVMLIISLIIVGLSVIGTFVHLGEYMIVDYTHYERPKYVDFALCFSVVKNTKIIFGTDNVPSEKTDDIGSLHGIRVIAMSWIILGNVMEFSTPYLRDNVLITQWLGRFSMQIVLSTNLAVDTFFIMSGLLVSYNFMKHYHNPSNTSTQILTCSNLPYFAFKQFVRRYFRLTPLYAYVIFFSTYLLSYFTDGPFKFSLDPPDGKLRSACRKYYWTNLLYINNFFHKKDFEPCFGIGWYLATNMQFFLLSTIVLISVKRAQLNGALISTFIFILAALIANLVLISQEKTVDTLLVPRKDIFTTEQFNYPQSIYRNFITRVTPYFTGMLLGYILNSSRTNTRKNREDQRKWKKALKCSLIWMTSAFLAAIAICMPYNNVISSWNRLDHVLYGSFFSIAWSISISLVIFTCQNGLAGIINEFLSWGFFVPLSRLTYATYLIHILLIKLYYSSMRKPVYLTEVFLIYLYIGMSVLSYLTAFLFAVFVEFPVRHFIDFIVNFKRSGK